MHLKCEMPIEPIEAHLVFKHTQKPIFFISNAR